MFRNGHLTISFQNLIRESPHIIQDTIWLGRHFYQNSPTITSRIIPVFLKYIIDIFVLPNNALSKDANPASSSVIREAVTLPSTALNIALGTKYVISKPETLDLTHLGANTLRFTCKSFFQVIPNNLTDSDSVMLSRGSNIVCDAFGVIGLDISKTSQQAKATLALEYSVVENFRVPTYEFLKGKVTPEYLVISFATAAFKSAIMDQMGEMIKLIKETKAFNSFSFFIEENKNNVLMNLYNISSALLETEYDNIYTQMDTVLEATNNSTEGYVINSILAIHTVSIKALPDLFITGPAMLASAADAINYYYSLPPISIENIKTLITGSGDYLLADGQISELPLSQTILSVATSIIGFFYKEEIFLHIVNITPELAAVALGMTLSNNFYDSYKGSSTLFKVASVGAMFTYSHYKDDMFELFYGENAQHNDDL